MDRNIYFTLASERGSNEVGLRRSSDTSKLVAFNTVVPLFKARKVFFPTEYKTDPRIVEFINELSLASLGGFKSKHDDCIDTASQLSKLQPWKPSEEAPLVESGHQKGMWEIDVEEDVADRMSSYIV